MLRHNIILKPPPCLCVTWTAPCRKGGLRLVGSPSFVLRLFDSLLIIYNQCRDAAFKVSPVLYAFVSFCRKLIG